MAILPNPAFRPLDALLGEERVLPVEGDGAPSVVVTTDR